MTWISGPMQPSHDHTVYGDDETAQALERIEADRQQRAAAALAAQFLANADSSNNECNTELVGLYGQRVRERDGR